MQKCRETVKEKKRLEKFSTERRQEKNVSKRWIRRELIFPNNGVRKRDRTIERRHLTEKRKISLQKIG